MNQQRERRPVRGVPQWGSPVFWAGTGLLALGALWAVFSADEGMRLSMFWQIFPVLAGCGLLCAAKDRPALYPAAGLLFFAGLANGLPAMLAALFWTMSAAGMRLNRAPRRLPEMFALPAYSIAALAAAALSAAAAITDGQVWMIFASLGLASLSLCQRAQQLPDGEQRPCLRTVRTQAPLCWTGAALFAVSQAHTIWQMLRAVPIDSMRVLDIVWLFVPLAAGILLLLPGQRRETWFVSFGVLMTLSTLRTMWNAAAYYGVNMGPNRAEQVLMLCVYVFLILGAAGRRCNTPPLEKYTRMPLFSFVCAVLLSMLCVQQIVYVLSFGFVVFTHNFKRLVLEILPQAGLLVLCLGTSVRALPERERRGAGVDLDGRRRGLLGWFFHDVGGSLQRLARIYAGVFFVLGALSAACAVLGLLLTALKLLGLFSPYSDFTMLIISGLIGIPASLIAAVGAWPLYAFGQLTSDVHALRGAAPQQKSAPCASSPAEQNPDELPEL